MERKSFGIGDRVVIFADYDGELNGGEPVDAGTEGVVRPQYIDGVTTPSPIWSDGTVLVVSDDGARMSVPASYVSKK